MLITLLTIFRKLYSFVMTNEKEPAATPSEDEPITAAESSAIPADQEKEENAAIPANETGEETPAEASPPEDPLTVAEAQSKANYERYLRSVADFENFRRRSLREKEELRKYATSALIEDILPALDNLELGLMSARHHQEGASIAQGFIMVAQQLKSVLQSHGLQEINPEKAEFDPHRHESTGQEPDEEVPEGMVLRVHRKGYLLHDRLLRPAMVILSSGAADAASENEEQPSTESATKS